MLAYHVFCYLVTLLFCSIKCAQIEPQFEVISIWNSDRKFFVCRKITTGRVEWFAPNGRPVGVSPLSTVYQVCNYNECKLFFVRPYKVSSGKYVCKHFREDDDPVIEDDIEVKIFNSIDMTESPVLYISQVGDDLAMECVVKFDADLTEAQVLWTHENNQLIADLSRYKVESQTIKESVTEKVFKNTMTIRKVESGDAGFYMCQAIFANEFLSDIKKIEVEVIVQYKAKFRQPPRKLIWINDEHTEDKEFNFELKCLAEGDPSPKYEWFIGNQSLHDNLPLIPSFFEILTKDNASILTIRLKSIDKFKYYTKELKNSSKDIVCKASNDHGNDTLTFDFEFGQLPTIPRITYFNAVKANGYINMEINYTESEPPVDMFKLVLSSDYHIYFNKSFKVRNQDNVNNYLIPYDKREIMYLDLSAHNQVGWSRPTEMQDTTSSTNSPDEIPGVYEWKLSNTQICVLLFILFLLVASTTVQVVYFNFCDQGDQES